VFEEGFGSWIRDLLADVETAQKYKMDNTVTSAAASAGFWPGPCHGKATRD